MVRSGGHGYDNFRKWSVVMQTLQFKKNRLSLKCVIDPNNLKNYPHLENQGRIIYGRDNIANS